MFGWTYSKAGRPMRSNPAFTKSSLIGDALALGLKAPAYITAVEVLVMVY